VALIQNDGLICLRHPQTVPVLVQSVKSCSKTIDSIVFGSPHWTRFELMCHKLTLLELMNPFCLNDLPT
jgi:hypothetical protein